MNDLEQKIKMELLQDLIEKMNDAGGSRMKPKGLGVTVEAPDKAHLAEGLDKAKDLLGDKSPMGSDESRMAEMAGKSDQPSGGGDDDDLSADDLMSLLGDDDDKR